MPARVTFLLGRSGSGKTRRLHRCIKEALDKGRRVVVIVPEQFTFETERQLASELGGTTLLPGNRVRDFNIGAEGT